MLHTQPLLALALLTGIAFAADSLANSHKWIGHGGASQLPSTASVHHLDDQFAKLVPVGAVPEVIATGFQWSEGPAWISGWPSSLSPSYLLFSDVKANRIYKWSEATGLSIFQEGSGCTDNSNNDVNLPCTQLVEPGSNGIALHKLIKSLIVCQHGKRQVVALLPTNQTVVLASHHRGKRLNSPNDLTIAANGDIYFTDPSYGLNAKEYDERREQYHNGVYRIPFSNIQKLVVGEKVEGEVIERMGVTQMFARPNGIALTPDGSKIVLSDAHPDVGRWEVCQVSAGDGLLYGCKLFQLPASTTQTRWAHLPGNADGLKVDANGNVWTTARGGVHVYTSSGKEIGFIQTGVKTGNLAFSDTHVYICADSQIIRVALAQ